MLSSSFTRLTFEYRSTDALSPEIVLEMGALARESRGDAAAERLRNLLERSEAVLFSRNVHGLAAFEIVQSRYAGASDLIRLGPSFTRGDAHVALFAWWLSRWLSHGQPFCFVMEVERQDVLEAIRELLPTTAYPRRVDTAMPLEAQWFASLYAATFDDVRGLDARTLTIANTDPTLTGHAERRQLVIVPCDGTMRSRERIGADLRRGMWARSSSEAVHGSSAL